jgi:hypothetical protein
MSYTEDTGHLWGYDSGHGVWVDGGRVQGEPGQALSPTTAVPAANQLPATGPPLLTVIDQESAHIWVLSDGTAPAAAVSTGPAVRSYWSDLIGDPSLPWTFPLGTGPTREHPPAVAGGPPTPKFDDEIDQEINSPAQIVVPADVVMAPGSAFVVLDDVNPMLWEVDAAGHAVNMGRITIHNIPVTRSVPTTADLTRMDLPLDDKLLVFVGDINRVRQRVPAKPPAGWIDMSRISGPPGPAGRQGVPGPPGPRGPFGPAGMPAQTVPDIASLPLPTGVGDAYWVQDPGVLAVCWQITPTVEWGLAGAGITVNTDLPTVHNSGVYFGTVAPTDPGLGSLWLVTQHPTYAGVPAPPPIVVPPLPPGGTAIPVPIVAGTTPVPPGTVSAEPYPDAVSITPVAGTPGQYDITWSLPLVVTDVARYRIAVGNVALTPLTTAQSVRVTTTAGPGAPVEFQVTMRSGDVYVIQTAMP